eukprot:9498583-Pyramimonas_sp.AAC.1
MQDSLGAVGINAEILAAAGRLLSTCSGPAIMGGDWNMAPIDLEQSLFPQQVDMVLAFPAQATFRGGMGASTIDFFCLNDAVVRGYRGVNA